MNAIGLLILGVVLLIIAYYLPAGPPPFVRVILNIVGWICIAIAVILIIAMLLGMPVGFGALR